MIFCPEFGLSNHALDFIPLRTTDWKGKPMADFSDPAVALQALTDPLTRAEDLAAIAAAQPTYGALVAAHPNAYPALLDWLDQNGDFATREAVAGRRITMPPAQQPFQPQSPAYATAPQQPFPGQPQGYLPPALNPASNKIAWAAVIATCLSVIFSILIFAVFANLTCYTHSGTISYCTGPTGALTTVSAFTLVFGLAAFVLGIIGTSQASRYLNGNRGGAITSIVIGILIALFGFGMTISSIVIMR